MNKKKIVLQRQAYMYVTKITISIINILKVKSHINYKLFKLK